MRFITSSIAALTLVFGASAFAQESYPSKPVKIVVPWPPGGVADYLGRAVAEKLTQGLGQPFIIENRPGAGTNIGSEVVAKSPPDGYTLLIASSNNAVNMSLYKDLGYDAAKDFEPISLLALVPNILVVNPAVPAQSVNDLIRYAKANPNKLSYASAGNGSPAHLAAEQFKRMAQVEILGVPYKGAAPAVTDLIGGHVHIMFTNIPASLGAIKANKLRALGVGGTTRSPALPEVPTIAESVPGYEAVAWYGLVAPAGTPKAIVERIHAEMLRGMKTPEMSQRLVQQGTEPVLSSPEKLAEQIRADIVGYRKLIQASGIQTQ